MLLHDFHDAAERASKAGLPASQTCVFNRPLRSEGNGADLRGRLAGWLDAVNHNINGQEQLRVVKHQITNSFWTLAHLWIPTETRLDFISL